MTTRKTTAKKSTGQTKAAKATTTPATTTPATTTPATTTPATTTPAKATPAKSAQTVKKAATTKTAPKAIAEKMSALDVAAKVLGEAKEPMTTRQMIETMAAKGYWSSPGGKTPAATLYSALLREITKKGDAARFAKVARGQFTLKS